MADYCTPGYHTTTISDARSILSRHIFIDSNGPQEWLGKGFYFFAYLYDAKQWRTKNKRLIGKETCILAADLMYSKEQLLDLDNPEDLETLEAVLSITAERNSSAKKPISIESNKALWEKRICAACNLARKFYPKIGIIIYTFSNHQRTEFQNNYFFQMQRQMCVSDHSIIHNIRMEGS